MQLFREVVAIGRKPAAIGRVPAVGRVRFAVVAASSRRRTKRKREAVTLDRSTSIRLRYALDLRLRGEVEGWEALRLTVWPPAKLEEVPAQSFWPAELAEEARRLFREGFSLPAIAERLAVPVPTAKQWVWNDVPDGYRRVSSRACSPP